MKYNCRGGVGWSGPAYSTYYTIYNINIMQSAGRFRFSASQLSVVEVDDVARQQLLARPEDHPIVVWYPTVADRIRLLQLLLSPDQRPSEDYPLRASCVSRRHRSSRARGGVDPVAIRGPSGDIHSLCSADLEALYGAPKERHPCRKCKCFIMQNNSETRERCKASMPRDTWIWHS